MNRPNVLPNIAGEHLTLRDADVNAWVVSSALRDFSEADYEAAIGAAHTAVDYATTKAAQKKLRSLSKWGYRYALSVGRAPAGMVSLMDIGATREQRVKRLVGNDTHTDRTVNGILNANRLPEDLPVPEAATETMDLLARAAVDFGLRSLTVVKTPEGDGKNPTLVVIEHAADLPGLGYEQVGEGAFTDQGTNYSGPTWRLHLQPPTTVLT
ncbi:MAG: hypothetical protein KDE31_34550 [Caldilineaceae bacterium]|nr:hypothetical protein [Caldilineaceae bacterium]